MSPFLGGVLLFALAAACSERRLFHFEDASGESLSVYARASERRSRSSIAALWEEHLNIVFARATITVVVSRGGRR